ncbi:MAG: TraB/GumN family protein [Spirochaetales bacterium]
MTEKNTESQSVKNLKTLAFSDKEIILLGTAHVSKQSIDDVISLIHKTQPDCVAIELDAQRYATMQDSESWKKLDIVKVLKEGRGFVMIANLVLSSFQKRIGSDMGVKPGDEMKAAITASQELNIQTAMVDRPVQITLQRAWRKNSFWGKCKLLATLFSSVFEKEKISAEQIESLKESSEMDSMMAELSEYLPTIKEVLIDERDQYLACKIWDIKAKKVFAVLGAGHLPGVERFLNEIADGTQTSDTATIETLPKPGIASKILGGIFPFCIIALIIAGFFIGGTETSVDLFLRWILWNGSLSALGTLLALGHPLAIITGFVAAPLGTINPFIAVGMFTGLVQAWVKKPQIADMEHLTDDFSSIKGMYKNRILRILLVFALSSLGGAIGNFIAVPALLTSLF